MCEAYPGPRCSPEMLSKLNTRVKKLTTIENSYGKDSYEYVKQAALVEASQKDYDATPKGLQALKDQITVDSENDTLIKRYITASNIRTMQQNAVGEIRNGRKDIITDLFLPTQTFYSLEELSTLIDASREAEETKQLKTDTLVNKLTQDEHIKQVDELKTQLTVFYKGVLPEEVETAIQKLYVSGESDEVTMRAYLNIPTVINNSRKQLNQEIQKIAVLNNITPSQAADLYDSYRTHYNMVYAGLPESQQPNPPEKWVRGELAYGSFTRNSKTNLIPRDPASLYAVYKLNCDPDSVPDYLKKRKNFSSITAEPTSTGETLLTVSTFTPNGRKVSTKTFTQTAASNGLQGHTANHKQDVLAGELLKVLENKTLLTLGDKTSTEYVQSLFKPHQYAELQTFNIADYALKHYTLPQMTVKALASEAGVKLDADNSVKKPSDADLFFRIEKNVKAQWGQKVSRKTLPHIDIISSPRWYKK